MSVEPYAELREVLQKTERLKILNGLGLKDKIIVYRHLNKDIL